MDNDKVTFTETELQVVYEDGRVERLVADQRDTAKVQEWALRRGMTPPQGRHLAEVAGALWARVLAWAAFERHHATTVEWAEWSGRVVQVLVEDIRDVDPTSRAHGGTS